MKLYYYVHTGHRVGLDRLRRSAPVINALRDLGIEATLLTNDFRAGEFAKEQFGIGRYVSVDVVRNIANIATPADALVFDSLEEGRAMWEDMADYFECFVRISDDPEDYATKESGLIRSPDLVDNRYFGSFKKRDRRVYFWGDADYDKELAALAPALAPLKAVLLEGYYFFMQYADELRAHFVGVEESEVYDTLLTEAPLFLTSSPQSALEALAAGSWPVYVPKPSAPKYWEAKMGRYGIPVVPFSDLDSAKQMAETSVYKPQLLPNDAPAEIASYIKDKLS